MNKIIKSKIIDKKTVISFLLLVSLTIVILKSVWICYDAYISFRYAKNFINGFGLKWNIHERVLASSMGFRGLFLS